MSDSIKKQIVELSLKQFEKHGIRKMTVRNLVEPLGMSTKTVYKYFPDKESLLKECLRLHYSKLATDAQGFENENLHPPSMLLRTGYKTIQLDFGTNHLFYHDLNYYYPELQDATLGKQYKAFAGSLLKLLADGASDGYFKKDLNPEVVLISFRTLYSSITRTDHFKKLKLTPKELLKNTVETYVRGLCTEKGLNDIEKNYSRIIQ